MKPKAPITLDQKHIDMLLAESCNKVENRHALLSELSERQYGESLPFIESLREAFVSGKAQPTQSLTSDGRLTYVAGHLLDDLGISPTQRPLAMPAIEKALRFMGFTKEAHPGIRGLWAAPEDPEARDAVKFDPSYPLAQMSEERRKRVAHPRSWEAEERSKRGACLSGPFAW